MTRKETRDMMDKHDAFISKLGQKEAQRYLRSKEQVQPTGFIREIILGSLYLTLLITLCVIALMVL